MHDAPPPKDANVDRFSIEGVSRGAPVSITFDGVALASWAGESIAAALYRADVVAFRRTLKAAEPRGYYCGMGVCFECLVEVDGVGGLRACRTAVKDGMSVRTERT